MTDVTRSPDPSPPLLGARHVKARMGLPAASLASLVLASAVGCTNQVADEKQFELIETLANEAPDLAGADDLVRVEGFDRELEGGVPSELNPCSGSEGCASMDDLEEMEELAQDSDEILFNSSMSVDQAVWNACSTSVLRALTDQLVEEIECMRPDTMGTIDELVGVTLGSGATPYLQTRAVTQLDRARQIGGSVHINSSLRSLAQQFLLYRWFQTGRCNIGLAASPGRSNHESGLAVDVNNWSARRSAFQNAGWRWLGSRDPVHFDYLGSGTVSLRGLSVLAFQRLWNRNNPGDQISEDGAYGPQTAARLAAAPTGGFDSGASCNAFDDVEDLDALEVYFARQDDDSYDLRALASSNVVRVETFVDAFRIAVATRADGNNFPENYTFDTEGDARRIDVIGLDASNNPVAAGVGYLDVTSDMSFSLKQMGANLFEVFLERANPSVASINVLVDGHQLVDGISGRAPSPRNAVRAQIHTLGTRTFEIELFDANGNLIDTIERSFDLTPRLPDGIGEPEPEPEPEAEPEAEPEGEPDPIDDDPCANIGSAGGVINEDGSCVTLGGNPQFLRAISGDGHSGDYVWTGATASATGSNFAKYGLNFDGGGSFLVEVSIPASPNARTRSAKYFVRNQGSTKAIVVDQDANAGFVGVGIFDFSGTGDQFVSLYDNTGENSSQGRKVVFDAVRLTPVSDLSCTSAVVTAGNLNVRRQANTNQSAVDQVQRNDVVQGLGVVDGQAVNGNTEWMRIRKGSLTGYVSMEFLSCQ